MDRFTAFTLSIARLNKYVQKLKTEGMQPLGLKATHTMVIHQLLETPHSTFSDLCRSCDLDQAQVSRTLKDLCASGHVIREGVPGRYNCTYDLTDSGRKAHMHIQSIVDHVITEADRGISPEELELFYSVLERLLNNFEKLCEEGAAQ